MEPWSVVYQQDKFFVSYPKANRVMIFNNAGEYLYDIGSNGSGDGQFEFPTGLAIDKFNRLIVCDTINWRLQLFTLDGKYVAKLAGRFLTIILTLLVVPCLKLDICLLLIKTNTVFMFSISTVCKFNTF